jgi:hypothetical protein
MKTQNIHYIAADELNVVNKIGIINIIDFCNLIEKHHVKEVFILEKDKIFAIAYNHLLLTIAQNGYKNLDDSRDSFQNNFSQAEDYYDARTLHIKTFENYQLMKSCGIQDGEIFKKMEEKNFMEGFKQLNHYLQENQNNTVSFKNPYELYTFATDNHFKDYESFFKAFKNGFTNFHNQSVALEKGFVEAREYKLAMDNDFPNYESYNDAKQFDITTFEELMKKKHLEIEDEHAVHDQKILILILNKIDQGKKVSLNKIKSLIEEELKSYHNAENNLPKWFKSSLNDNKTLEDFLLKHEKAIKLGNYDSDGEFFEIKPLNDRSVVIDASNVAHNSRSSADNKPYLQNIITMVKFLKKKGFTDIIIIADASLRHKVADIDKLGILENEATYFVSPPETSADHFLLSMVKTKHCLIISNDTFKDHKREDSWIASNIDYFRLSFMITKDGVMMPELEK